LGELEKIAAVCTTIVSVGLTLPILPGWRRLPMGNSPDRLPLCFTVRPSYSRLGFVGAVAAEARAAFLYLSRSIARMGLVVVSLIASSFGGGGAGSSPLGLAWILAPVSG